VVCTSAERGAPLKNLLAAHAIAQGDQRPLDEQLHCCCCGHRGQYDQQPSKLRSLKLNTKGREADQDRVLIQVQGIRQVSEHTVQFRGAMRQLDGSQSQEGHDEKRKEQELGQASFKKELLQPAL
jgi:hypothetical protein